MSVMKTVFGLMLGCTFTIIIFLNTGNVSYLLITTLLQPLTVGETNTSSLPVPNNLTSDEVMKERKTSYPFRGDGECQHFFVQVDNIILRSYPIG